MFVTLSKDALLRLILEVAVSLSPGQCLSIDLWGFQVGGPLNLTASSTGTAHVQVWEPSEVKNLTGGMVPKQPVMGAIKLFLKVRPFVCAGQDKVSSLMMTHEVGHFKEFLEGGESVFQGKVDQFMGLPTTKHLRAEQYADSYLFRHLKQRGADPSLCDKLGRDLKGITSRDPRLAEEDPFVTGYPRDSERVAACKAALSE
jgi:hypothetical protein